MKRNVKITTNCIADRYGRDRNVRIVEFSGDGGGLISFRTLPDGRLKIDVYCTDANVFVVGPTMEEAKVPEAAEATR